MEEVKKESNELEAPRDYELTTSIVTVGDTKQDEVLPLPVRKSNEKLFKSVEPTSNLNLEKKMKTERFKNFYNYQDKQFKLAEIEEKNKKHLPGQLRLKPTEEQIQQTNTKINEIKSVY